MFFFFNDTATTEIYTLSLHDALPISVASRPPTTRSRSMVPTATAMNTRSSATCATRAGRSSTKAHASSKSCSRPISRSEEHTSELQSRQYLVCRLLLEKKKYNIHHTL